MRIGEQIKNYRKTEGLTQEQVANYLGVSTPAVNKWEKGNTYPDISLLPALARLLKIDMNELFSFREELTEKEIGLFRKFHWTALQRLSRWHLVKYRSILIATY